MSSPLIFVDPDNGLQVKKSNKRHLLYSEAKMLCELMGKDSILMIYQHFPRARHKHRKCYCPEGRAELLKKGVGVDDLPLWVSDKEIFFLFLTHSSDLRNKLVDVICKYKNIYPNIIEVPDKVKCHAEKYGMRM